MGCRDGSAALAPPTFPEKLSSVPCIPPCSSELPVIPAPGVWPPWVLQLCAHTLLQTDGQTERYIDTHTHTWENVNMSENILIYFPKNIFTRLLLC